MLKARNWIHLSKKYTFAYDSAYEAVTKAEALNVSNASNFNAVFDAGALGSGLSNDNTYNQYLNNRGDACAGKFIVDTMVAMQDPRRIVMFDTTYSGPDGIIGSAPGSGDGGDYIGPGILYVQKFGLVTAAELYFIKAECLLKRGDVPGSRAALQTAGNLSFDQWGMADNGAFGTYYLQAYDNATTDAQRHYLIMLQKYIHLMMNTEAYTEWRRTNYPVLTPATNTSINYIPRIFPTPFTEITANPNAQPVNAINPGNPIRVWWDQ
jgi:hypothetical protein